MTTTTTICNEKRRCSMYIYLDSRSRRLLIVALVALSLAVLLQLLPTTECAKSEPKASNKKHETTTTTAAPDGNGDEDEEEEEPPKKDPGKSVKPTKSAKDLGEDDGEEEEDDDDEKEGKSRSAIQAKDATASAGRANENSGVEKGTKTELPAAERDGSTTQAPSGSSTTKKKDGIIRHSDNPKAKAQKVDKKSTPTPTTGSTEKPTTESTTTPTTEAPESGDDEPKRAPSAKPTRGTKSPKIDDADEAESRSATDALRRILGGESPQESAADSRADVMASANGTAAAKTTTSSPTTVAPGENKEPAGGGGQENSDAAIKRLEDSDGGGDNNLTQKIEQLGEQTKQLDERKNSTITINGRKFDQIGSVECVDDKFYDLLMRDLNLIDPNARRDFYGTYYDYEYAKAVQAIVDTPVLAASSRSGLIISENTSRENKTFSFSSESERAKKTLNGTGSMAPDDPHLDVKKLDVLADIRRFWNETFVTYKTNKARLDKSRSPSATGPATTVESKQQRPGGGETKPVQTSALENYQYLLRRLEELKVMMLNGEEALIVMNNRVKKLNQAVGEPDLQKALCSCITSRSGRAAFSMMNELFVDKKSDKLIKDLERAKGRANEAALDTAEFCAYWYGDTIRSQAVQKEKEIKKLVLSVVREQTQKNIEMKFGNEASSATTTAGPAADPSGGFTAKLNKTEVIREEHTIVKGGIRYHQIKTRIVTKIVQMTSLWLPRLANWIKQTLNQTGTVNTSSDQISKLIHRQEESNSNSSSKPAVATSSVQSALKKRVRKRRQDNELDSYMVSTPFDERSNYADVDDPVNLESSAILQSFIANNYMPDFMRRRLRRDVSPSTTTTTPIPVPSSKAPATSTTRPASTSTSTAKPATSKLPIISTSAAPSGKGPTTTGRPLTTGQANDPMGAADEGGDFETRIAERTSKCAVDGFGELLKIGFDQNSLMYESNSIKADEPYIVTLRETFAGAFASAWAQKRDAWSKHLAGNATEGSSRAATIDSSAATTTAAAASNQTLGQHDSRSVDEEIDNSFESSASSYDRGARLGYTIGKFIGEKAARQWPDPAELNTFTYDSLFLAGVSYGHDEEKSRQLERHIVAETAKRVAFTEANRVAFAKSIRVAYLNGAFVVPLFGVLHAQRSVAKRAAEEAGKVGFEAASRAAEEFTPKAVKFFEMHQHQRSLAAPYKANKRLSDKWEGLMEQIKSVQLESELGRNLTKLAIDCGQKSATLMGALMGLIVTPEAFETYTRFRGSLEALENEFNQYKLGAMRGYELGESWAYLNYTIEMNQNLRAMKTKMEGPEGSGRASVLAPATQGATSSSTSTTTSPKASLAATAAAASTASPAADDENKKKATETVAAKVAQDRASQLARESSASSLFDKADPKSKETNTNNIFQYMVLNYGTHLVANHSRKHMLKLRSLYIDEDLLKDLKFQSRDLIPDPENMAASQPAPIVVDPIEQLFVGGNYIGELKGVFNNPLNEHHVPIKFNIIDLGPLLEFADEVEDQKDLGKSSREQPIAPTTGNSSSSSPLSLSSNDHPHDELKSTPLTSALAKVGKVYMKFNVARKKKPHQTASDAVALYLNSNDFDEGDGYVCGTFSQMSTVEHPQKDAPPNGLAGDDLSLEAMMLDELFLRIESAPLSLGTIELTENVMAMTTLAPRRVESIRDPQKSSTTTTTLAPTSSRSPTTTATSSTTASPQAAPTSTATTTSKPSKQNAATQKPTGSSRSAKISKAWLEDGDEAVLKTTTTTTESPDDSSSSTTTTTTEEPKETSKESEESQERETKDSDD